ncbi:hypothetical protein [Jannaschia sp. R86511]|uniref:hypothetical protein n=1 Tax=Jannaschia sp. R86511 TaxID=3093853 RepID=UPI0036D38CE8
MTRAVAVPGRAAPGRSTAVAVLLALALSGCAGLPTADPAAGRPATGAAAPVVTAEQAQRVRSEVAARLQAAREAADPDLVPAGALGPAEAFARLRVAQDGAQPGGLAPDPEPATVLVAPQVAGWPRWFATVTVPGAGTSPDAGALTGPTTAAATTAGTTTSGATSGSTTSGSTTSGSTTSPAALPVLELYDAQDVRSPYRLWARMTMLPGARLPTFPAVEVGADALADGTGPEGTGDDGTAEPSEEDELRLALADLAERYASVLSDGDASPAAAEFEPDPFVSAVRARTEAERAAVDAVATTVVTHEAYAGGDLLYAVRGADGDVLAVTAVESTTTMTARPGAGVLRPDAEVAAVAGIDETDGTLSTRSLAALAFVVPAEQGAIRLVAVGEGLVAADAS